MRCHGKTISGVRCKNTTNVGKYCNLHKKRTSVGKKKFRMRFSNDPDVRTHELLNVYSIFTDDTIKDLIYLYEGISRNLYRTHRELLYNSMVSFCS